MEKNKNHENSIRPHNEPQKQARVQVLIRPVSSSPVNQDDPNSKNFWTRPRTESLLDLLADQAKTTGDINHTAVAKTLSRSLKLPNQVTKQHVVDRLDTMFQLFQSELRKEEKSKQASSWIWMKKLQYLVDLIQNAEDNRQRTEAEKKTTQGGVSVIRPVKEVPISPASKPHPVIVPLKTPTEIKPVKSVQSTLVLPNPKGVDIKIGIPSMSKIAATTVASATVPIAMKNDQVLTQAANGNLVFTVKNPILNQNQILISNVVEAKVPTEKQPQSVLKVVQKSEVVEPVRTAVISKPEIKSAPEPEVPKPKSGSASPRVAPVDEGNPQIERRNRMPDPHVDFMLRQYRSYLQERMHESGRLTKGTFNEIASDMNKEFNVTIYERGQIAAKLQNLKTQFRQKKACVESGGSHNEVESHWKWYQKLSEIVSIETSQRESAEGGRQVVPSPESLEILPERRSKRERKPPKVKNFFTLTTAYTPPEPERTDRSSTPKLTPPPPVLLSSGSDDEEDNEPISTIIKRKFTENSPKMNGNTPIKKVKVDPQTMEEAMLNLASIPKDSSDSSSELVRTRLREKKDELLQLRTLAFNLFQQVNVMLKDIED